MKQASASLAAVARLFIGFSLLATLFLSSVNALADLHWPQEIPVDGGMIIVFQPQPEKLNGNLLSGRAAFSIELESRDEPIFGAMWFTARIETDRDSDVVLVQSIQLDNVVWPESETADEKRFTAIVEAAVPESGFEISMERLAASLDTAEVVQKSLDDLNTDPPNIAFREELAVLLLYDGKPQLTEIEGSDYERVMNVPFAVACKKRGSGCWLSSGRFWYAADDAMGPWKYTSQPPADLKQMLSEVPVDDSGPTTPPAIVVATEPTELIVTEGKPDWVSLAGGELLYVSNTESPWLRELATGKMYLLLSGRWYRSSTQEGPWEFVRPDQLPDSFAQIPPASDVGGLRVSVAGTEEAEEAVLDAAIPQTAAIKRSEASLSVDYDGKPEFKKIDGTEVAYAVNTGAQVLEINGRYYAVDDGVWFTAASPTGPWAVADSVPEEEIAKIPPSEPVYNVTHVHVYQSTPEVVYVGYTPGYLWSYPYYGVPVYGTGWYYPPYWGRYYYPRPATYGFHVGYNPWTGWNFGFTWSNGFFSFGIGWGGGYYGGYRPWGCCGGWYGGGYRGPTFINNGDVNINIGNNVNIGNRVKVSDRMAGTPSIRDRSSNRNLYNRPENRTRNAEPALASRELRQARPATGRANDLYADRSGKVARKAGDGWETREGGKWSPANGDAAATRPSTGTATRPSTRPATTPSTRPASPSTRQSLNTRDLNRSHNARQSGARREMSRPTPRSTRQPARRPSRR